MNIINDFLHLEVVIMVQTLLDSPEVDWVFYDFEIVWDLKAVGVYWVVEDLGRVYTPK
mgnify:CR=1 FL=1